MLHLDASSLLLPQVVTDPKLGEIENVCAFLPNKLWENIMTTEEAIRNIKKQRILLKRSKLGDSEKAYHDLKKVIELQDDLEKAAPPSFNQAVISMRKLLTQHFGKLSKIKVGALAQCEAPKCSNWFIPETRGQEQRFCSKQCRNREGVRRHRAL